MVDLDNREPYANSIPLPYCHLHTTDHSSSTLVCMYKVAWAMMPELARLCKFDSQFIFSNFKLGTGIGWEVILIPLFIFLPATICFVCSFTQQLEQQLACEVREMKRFCAWIGTHIKVQEMLRQESKGASSVGQSH